MSCNCSNCKARTDAQFWQLVELMTEPTAYAVRHSLGAPTQWGEEDDDPLSNAAWLERYTAWRRMHD